MSTLTVTSPVVAPRPPSSSPLIPSPLNFQLHLEYPHRRVHRHRHPSSPPPRCPSTSSSIWGADDILRFAFDVFDEDHSGEIDLDELKELIRMVNEADSKFPGKLGRWRHRSPLTATSQLQVTR